MTVEEPTTQHPGFQKILEVEGSISAFARALKISHQCANRWVKQGYVPVERALEIEKLYGISARDFVKPGLLEIAERLTS